MNVCHMHVCILRKQKHWQQIPYYYLEKYVDMYIPNYASLALQEVEEVSSNLNTPTYILIFLYQSVRRLIEYCVGPHSI